MACENHVFFFQFFLTLPLLSQTNLMSKLKLVTHPEHRGAWLKAFMPPWVAELARFLALSFLAWLIAGHL